jgi:hypothetical protein
MSTMPRRSALVACAALALPVHSDVEEVDENPRPVFVPSTHSPVPEINVDTLNARAWERHEAEVWVYDHRDNLPTEYEEIDRLPANQRHALLDALPLATATTLLRERIRRCADADPDLNAEQRATIALTVETLTPEWFDASLDEREETKDGFWPRTSAIITSEEWSRIFGDVDTLS